MAIATDALGNTSEIGPAAAHGPLLGLGAAVACEGDNAILATFNLGSGVSYRWRKGAMVLAGQTNAEIQFSPVTLGDAGEYCVEMTGISVR
jgi:hypothetical protein